MMGADLCKQPNIQRDDGTTWIAKKTRQVNEVRLRLWLRWLKDYSARRPTAWSASSSAGSVNSWARRTMVAISVCSGLFRWCSWPWRAGLAGEACLPASSVHLVVYQVGIITEVAYAG